MILNGRKFVRDLFEQFRRSIKIYFLLFNIANNI